MSQIPHIRLGSDVALDWDDGSSYGRVGGIGWRDGCYIVWIERIPDPLYAPEPEPETAGDPPTPGLLAHVRRWWGR